MEYTSGDRFYGFTGPSFPLSHYSVRKKNSCHLRRWSSYPLQGGVDLSNVLMFSYFLEIIQYTKRGVSTLKFHTATWPFLKIDMSHRA